MKLTSLFSILFLVNTSIAYAGRTPDQCRSSCGTSPDNWCLTFGTSGTAVALPYISIINLAAKKANGSTKDACNQTIAIAGEDLELSGSNCTNEQSNANITTKTDYFSKARAKIHLINNTTEVIFEFSNPNFSFRSGGQEISGPVEYITTTIDLNGDHKVVWYNGEECFSAWMNY